MPFTATVTDDYGREGLVYIRLATIVIIDGASTTASFSGYASKAAFDGGDASALMSLSLDLVIPDDTAFGDVRSAAYDAAKAAVLAKWPDGAPADA